jgi:hypothetical protein
MNQNILSCSQVADQMNNSLYKRNVPSSELQPNINCRPTATKYSVFPVVELRKRVKYPLKRYPLYNPNNTFNPSDLSAPGSGYRKNVNVESELRNQIHALQKADMAVYVPNSTSDLYKPTIPYKQTFTDSRLMFKQEKFNSFNPDNFHLNRAVFNNSTRTQIKNINS